MRRLQPAFDGLEVVFASVHSAYAEEVPGHRFYAAATVTRWDRIGLAILVAQLTFILLRERPRVVVTTGSASWHDRSCTCKMPVTIQNDVDR